MLKFLYRAYFYQAIIKHIAFFLQFSSGVREPPITDTGGPGVQTSVFFSSFLAPGVRRGR